MTRRAGLVSYLILIHLLLGLVIVKSDFLDRAARRLGALPAELSAHYHAMLAYHRRMDEQIPAHATLFIGDSITQSLAVTRVAANAVNYGIGGDTTAGVLQRLPVYQSLARADAVVLAIGVNDLKRRSDEEILANYARILERLPRHLRVVVSALLPVDERLWGGPGVNRRIQAINQGLKRLTGGREERVFCDVGERLAGADGNLEPAYHRGDGIHLSAPGYQIWADALRTSLATWEQPPGPDPTHP